jgi:hypothetical protein
VTKGDKPSALAKPQRDCLSVHCLHTGSRCSLQARAAAVPQCRLAASGRSNLAKGPGAQCRWQHAPVARTGSSAPQQLTVLPASWHRSAPRWHHNSAELGELRSGLSDVTRGAGRPRRRAQSRAAEAVYCA